MGYIALVSTSISFLLFIVLAVFAGVPEPTLTVIGTVTTWFILGNLGITGAYMGLSTFEPKFTSIK